MGTRHLIAVQHDGKYKLAQYGQWDGYPDGQGTTVLAFAREHLDTKKKQAAFVKQLDARVRFVTEQDDLDKLWQEAVGKKPSKSGFEAVGDANTFGKKFPGMSRDTGGDILELVRKAKAPLFTRDSIDFAADSLFCEWAYVVDLDKGTLEVFKGFNQKPLEKGERFAKLKDDATHRKPEDKYYPVKLKAQFKLDDLPNEKNFLARFAEEDEE